jgi:formate hydrogenlyase subunit 4
MNLVIAIVVILIVHRILWKVRQHIRTHKGPELNEWYRNKSKEFKRYKILSNTVKILNFATPVMSLLVVAVLGVNSFTS